MFSKKRWTSWLQLSAAALHWAVKALPGLQLSESSLILQFVVFTSRQSSGLISFIWNNSRSVVTSTYGDGYMDTIYRTTILPMDTIPLISHHHLAIYGYYLSSNYLWQWVPFEKTWVQQFYWYLVNVKTLDIKGNWNWKNTDIKSPTEGTTLGLSQWDQLQWGLLRLGQIFLANCELEHMQKRSLS